MEEPGRPAAHSFPHQDGLTSTRLRSPANVLRRIQDESIALLAPAVRTASGYRDFAPETIVRLDFIRRGRAAGVTLTQIREILHIRDAGQTPCKHVQDLLADRLVSLDAQITGLQDHRASVSQLYNDLAAADPDTSDTGQVCRYL